MEVEQKINWNLPDTRRALVLAGVSLFSSLAAACSREYHLSDEVRNPTDPTQITGRFSFTLYNGPTNPETGRYRLIIAADALTKGLVSHTVSIKTEPLLDLITVALVPTGSIPNHRTVRLIAELRVVQNSPPRDSRIHFLYQVDPSKKHTLEAYWSDLRFTRLTWNHELLKRPAPTPVDRSLA